MTTPANPVHELTEAAHLLREDGGATFGPLAPPVSALLLMSAQRLASQIVAWQNLPEGPERAVEGTYGEILTVARVVLQKAGRSW